jgi:diacylglycerol O-acyltransferase
VAENFTERMSKVDLAWLRMDSPRNLMMITGVLILNQGVDLICFKQVVCERLLRYPRFVSQVIQDRKNFSAVWQQDKNFDLDRHIVPAKLTGRADKAALERLVAKLAAQALSKDHPLWQFHVIDRYVQPDGSIKSALIVRLHHCMADGMALINLMLSMTSTKPGAERYQEEKNISKVAKHTLPAWEQTLATLLLQLESWAQPSRLGDSLSIMTQLASDLMQIISMPDDSRTCLKGKPAVQKRVAWNEPLALHEVKAVSRALGCSVNDVLLSCVSGAMGTYLRQQGQPTQGCEIRAMVPVNLRRGISDDPRQALGNKFGLVPLTLPVGIEHPLQRLYEIRTRMQALKGSYQALLSYAVLGAMGYLPEAVQQQVTAFLASKASAVMTNVPGPQQALYMAGARIEQILFWVPQSGDIGLGVSILSYDQQVQFGLIAAHNLVPEPEKIIQYFEPEFEKLLMLTLLCPWTEDDLDVTAAHAALVRKPIQPRHRRPRATQRA